MLNPATNVTKNGAETGIREITRTIPMNCTIRVTPRRFLVVPHEILKLDAIGLPLRKIHAAYFLK